MLDGEKKKGGMEEKFIRWDFFMMRNRARIKRDYIIKD